MGIGLRTSLMKVDPMSTVPTDRNGSSVSRFLLHYSSAKAATLYADPRIKAAADGAKRLIDGWSLATPICALDLIQAAHRGMVESLQIPQYGDVKKVLSPALGMNSHVISVLLSCAKVKLPFASRAKVPDDRSEIAAQDRADRKARDEAAIKLWNEGKPSLEVMLAVHPGKVWATTPDSARAGLFILTLRKKYGADRVPMRHILGPRKSKAEKQQAKKVKDSKKYDNVARDAKAMAQWRNGEPILDILKEAYPENEHSASKATQYIIRLRKRNGVEQVPLRKKKAIHDGPSTSNDQDQNSSQA